MIMFSGYGHTDTGRKRNNNQDRFAVDNDLQLYVIADGMGGHNGGELASTMAIELFIKNWREFKSSSAQHPPQTNAQSQNIKPFLFEILQNINDQLRKTSQQRTEVSGMGTTIVALVQYLNLAYLIQVGDSRGYLSCSKAFFQLTEDHSLVNEQYKSGMITEEQMVNHQYKNIVTQAIGIEDRIDPALYVREAKPGDAYLLCSDGLSNLVSCHEIAELVRTYHDQPERLVKNCIELANLRGGDDNVTVIFTRGINT